MSTPDRVPLPVYKKNHEIHFLMMGMVATKLTVRGYYSDPFAIQEPQLVSLAVSQSDIWSLLGQFFDQFLPEYWCQYEPDDFPELLSAPIEDSYVPWQPDQLLEAGCQMIVCMTSGDLSTVLCKFNDLVTNLDQCLQLAIEKEEQLITNSPITNSPIAHSPIAHPPTPQKAPPPLGLNMTPDSPYHLRLPTTVTSQFINPETAIDNQEPEEYPVNRRLWDYVPSSELESDDQLLNFYEQELDEELLPLSDDSSFNQLDDEYFGQL